MILQNSINNELNTFSEITDSTLIALQEFLTTIENSTTIKNDIAKKQGKNFSELAYKAYVTNYEHFKNKICPQDIAIFEKLANFICMSSFDTISLRNFTEFKNNYYITDSQQFSSCSDLATFNIPVGIEYKLCYKKEAYTGLVVGSNTSYSKGEYKLSSAYYGLFSSNYLKKISDGEIKVNRFKEGSFLKMKFLINSGSFDDFKANIYNILDEDLFKKWQFKGICNENELLSIRYIYTIQSNIEYTSLPQGDLSDLKSIDLITFKCISWVISTMSFTGDLGVKPCSGISLEIRDFVLPICMHYFVPQKDRKLFYKFTQYITFVTSSYSTMGYNGLTETNKEKSISILENMGKMERLIGKVIYNKSISKKEINLKINTFNSFRLLNVSTFLELEQMVQYVTNLESYKMFSPMNYEDKDESFLIDTPKIEPFKHLSISEEGMYLALMAIKSLYKMPDQSIRDTARETIIKRAKRFVATDDYEKFSEIIVKFTAVENEAFLYVPAANMNFNVSFYSSFDSYFDENMFVQKHPQIASLYYILIDGKLHELKELLNNTNSLANARQIITKSITDGKIMTRNNKALTNLDDYFIAFFPYIHELSWNFSDNILNKCPLFRNNQVSRLVESVLGVEYGYIATPKEDIEYEEISITNTDFNAANFNESALESPMINKIINDSTNSITSNTDDCNAYQQSNISATTESTVISNVTETNHLQNTNNQQLDMNNDCTVEDCFTFTWLDF